MGNQDFKVAISDRFDQERIAVGASSQIIRQVLNPILEEPELLSTIREINLSVTAEGILLNQETGMIELQKPRIGMNITLK